MHADFRAVSASTGLCTDRTSPIPAELAAISIPHGVQAPQGSTTLAVIVSGQLRALGTPDGLSAMQRFLSAALESLHLYLHVSAGNGRSAACSHANGENRINVTTIVSRLQPVWHFTGNVPAAVADRSCHGRNMSRIAHFPWAWKQWGRLHHAFAALRTVEANGGFQYDWVMRARTDLRLTPMLPTPSQLSSVSPGLYNGGEWQPQRFHVAPSSRPDSVSSIPRDYIQLVHRSLASSFFSVGLSYLACQNLTTNLQVCGRHEWARGSIDQGAGIHGPVSECVLKTHLERCVATARQAVRLIWRLPWWPCSSATVEPEDGSRHRCEDERQAQVRRRQASWQAYLNELRGNALERRRNASGVPQAAPATQQTRESRTSVDALGRQVCSKGIVRQARVQRRQASWACS